MASRQKEHRRETMDAESVLAKHSMAAVKTKEAMDGQRRIENMRLPKKVMRAEQRRLRKSKPEIEE